uniref:Uncharacterized protein n=1 Tax=uncultured organism MedDCM-OCT-S08-C288 TaxID=743637 RepID=D6PJ86_9ZZZZ|nr:hypothetical protein [uncultured organism MedDCM-OCT-S08-C288]
MNLARYARRRSARIHTERYLVTRKYVKKVGCLARANLKDMEKLGCARKTWRAGTRDVCVTESTVRNIMVDAF